MDVIGIIYAVICAVAWGSWLVPSEKVKFPTEQAKTFFVALATTIIAVIVVGIRGEVGQLSTPMAWLPLLGGLIWAISAYCAFVACKHIGIAKAFGIWAPLNVVVSFIWGLTLLGQNRDLSGIIWLVAVGFAVLMFGGIFMIIFSGGTGDEGKDSSKSAAKGLLGAVGAGILWGTFFIPAAYISQNAGDMPAVSPWASGLPLAVGMLIGTGIMVILTGKAPKLEKPSDYVRALSSGGLWALGFFMMLKVVDMIGAGPGYTIASLCVAVNALWGVFYFKDPKPKTRAAKLTLAGVAIATVAGILLGYIGDIDTKYKDAKGITPAAEVAAPEVTK